MDDNTSLSTCREVVVYYGGKISDHRRATRTDEISQLAGVQWVGRAGERDSGGKVEPDKCDRVKSATAPSSDTIPVFFFPFISVCHAKRSNWEFVVGSDRIIIHRHCHGLLVKRSRLSQLG